MTNHFIHPVRTIGAYKVLRNDEMLKTRIALKLRVILRESGFEDVRNNSDTINNLVSEIKRQLPNLSEQTVTPVGLGRVNYGLKKTKSKTFKEAGIPRVIINEVIKDVVKYLVSGQNKVNKITENFNKEDAIDKNDLKQAVNIESNIKDGLYNQMRDTVDHVRKEINHTMKVYGVLAVGGIISTPFFYEWSDNNFPSPFNRSGNKVRFASDKKELNAEIAKLKLEAKNLEIQIADLNITDDKGNTVTAHQIIGDDTELETTENDAGVTQGRLEINVPDISNNEDGIVIGSDNDDTKLDTTEDDTEVTPTVPLVANKNDTEEVLNEEEKRKREKDERERLAEEKRKLKERKGTLKGIRSTIEIIEGSAIKTSNLITNPQTYGSTLHWSIRGTKNRVKNVNKLIADGKSTSVLKNALKELKERIRVIVKSAKTITMIESMKKDKNKIGPINELIGEIKAGKHSVKESYNRVLALYNIEIEVDESMIYEKVTTTTEIVQPVVGTGTDNDPVKLDLNPELTLAKKGLDDAIRLAENLSLVAANKTTNPKNNGTFLWFTIKTTKDTIKFAKETQGRSTATADDMNDDANRLGARVNKIYLSAGMIHLIEDMKKHPEEAPELDDLLDKMNNKRSPYNNEQTAYDKASEDITKMHDDMLFNRNAENVRQMLITPINPNDSDDDNSLKGYVTGSIRDLKTKNKVTLGMFECNGMVLDTENKTWTLDGIGFKSENSDIKDITIVNGINIKVEDVKHINIIFQLNDTGTRVRSVQIVPMEK